MHYLYIFVGDSGVTQTTLLSKINIVYLVTYLDRTQYAILCSLCSVDVLLQRIHCWQNNAGLIV